MKNKKVGIITTVHPPFDIRIFERQAKTLVQAGYQVSLIANYTGNEIIEGIEMVPLPKARSRFFRIFCSVWIALYKALKIKAQIYHFHDPELIIAGLCLKICGKKVIYDVHENVCLQVSTKQWIPRFFRKIISYIVKFIEITALLCFDNIIVAGEDLGNQPHFSKFRYKIKLIRNFPVINLTSKDIFPKGNGQIRFIYTGGLTEERGILQIIEAFKLAGEINSELILLGHFDKKAFQEKVLEEIKGYNIKVSPPVPYHEMFKILAQSHIGLICFLPTPNNVGALSGRNNKIYEYLQAGLAVIGSDFPLWRDLIVRNNIGMVSNPTNVREIAGVMNYLCRHPDELMKMQSRAKELSGEFSWEREGQRLVEIYGKLFQT